VEIVRLELTTFPPMAGRSGLPITIGRAIPHKIRKKILSRLFSPKWNTLKWR